MNAHQDVSIRERVKKPPATAILESYFNPALTRALAGARQTCFARAQTERVQTERAHTEAA